MSVATNNWPWIQGTCIDRVCKNISWPTTNKQAIGLHEKHSNNSHSLRSGIWGERLRSYNSNYNWYSVAVMSVFMAAMQTPRQQARQSCQRWRKLLTDVEAKSNQREYVNMVQNHCREKRNTNNCTLLCSTYCTLTVLIVVVAIGLHSVRSH